MQFVSKAAFFALWCFVFSLPWDEIVTLPVLGSIPRVVGLIASGVGIVYILARRRVRQLAWFHVFAVLFVLWVGVTTVWSIDPAATRVRFITYLQLAVLVWLIWEIAWSPERRRALLQAYVLGACVAAGAVVYHFLSGSAMDTEAARFAALNQDPNELGLTLVLGIPMAWHLSLSQPDRRIGWIWQLYLPLAMTGVLLTASRASFLAGLVALAIVPWTQGGLRLRTKAALYALVVASVVLAARFAPEASLDRIRSTQADVAAGYFGGRGAIWSVGLHVAREHPMVGVGGGTFEAAVWPTLHRARSSHNVLLTILVEQGIIGLSLFVAMVMAAVQALGQLPPLQQRFWIVLVLALTVGSMSLSWGHRKQFWFVLGLLAAQAVQYPVRVRASQSTRPSITFESGIVATRP